MNREIEGYKAALPHIKAARAAYRAATGQDPMTDDANERIRALEARDMGWTLQSGEQEDRIKVLEEALRPFAVYAASVLRGGQLSKRPDSRPHLYRRDGSLVTYGNLRRARTALGDL